MAKKKSVKKATKVGSLPVRKGSKVKGGFLTNTSHTSISEAAEGLKTMAQKA